MILRLSLLCSVVLASVLVLGSTPIDTSGDSNWDNQPLTSQGLENVEVFAKLAGYVMNFHPSDGVQGQRWGDVWIQGMQEVEHARNQEELIAALKGIFKDIAPTVQVYALGEKRPEQKLEKTNTILYWKHTGFARHRTGGIAGPYESLRETAYLDKLGDKDKDGIPMPEQPCVVRLNDNIIAEIPLAVYLDENGKTLPIVATETPSENKQYTLSQRAVRLSDVALIWNTYQHFYPYFDLVKTDWNAALSDALQRAAQASSPEEVLNTARHLVSRAYDGHGVTFISEDENIYYPKIDLDFVEGKVVVVNIRDESTKDVKLGDIILEIDGRNIDDLLEERRELTYGSTPWHRNAMLVDRFLLMGPKDSEAHLKVKRYGGDVLEVNVKRDDAKYERSPDEYLAEVQKRKAVEEVAEGIYKVDIGALTNEVFDAAVPKLMKAKGLIYDFRGYPGFINWEHLFQPIIKQPIKSAFWQLPVFLQPDHQVHNYLESRWDLEPMNKPYTGKVVFLSSPRTVSYGESCLGMVEAYQIGDIIGGPTAGTNGNINPVQLPGGLFFIFTGMRVTKHDGSPHHGIGIHPTIPYEQTIKGVAEGRDEIVEKAIEVIEKGS